MVRRRLAAALSAVLVLPLAACASPTGPPPTVAPLESMPAFPRLAGSVLEQDLAAVGDWRVRIAVDDSGAAYAAARALLTDRGYTLTKDREGSDGGDGQACTERLCVDFTATEDPTYGPSVLYEVFHGEGVGG